MVTVDRNKALDALLKRGYTLKEWCKQEGYGYHNASGVLRGINRANYGAGKEIADKLNAMIRGDA